MRHLRSRTRLYALVVAFIAAGCLPVLAQAQTPTATPLEMRHFWHVFVAYALAWIILFGWIWSIVRRLRRTEARLSELDSGRSAS
jgi:CcmD family protein